jgi:hypothetical protein
LPSARLRIRLAHRLVADGLPECRLYVPRPALGKLFRYEVGGYGGRAVSDLDAGRQYPTTIEKEREI